MLWTRRRPRIAAGPMDYELVGIHRPGSAFRNRKRRLNLRGRGRGSFREFGRCGDVALLPHLRTKIDFVVVLMQQQIDAIRLAVVKAGRVLLVVGLTKREPRKGRRPGGSRAYVRCARVRLGQHPLCVASLMCLVLLRTRGCHSIKLAARGHRLRRGVPNTSALRLAEVEVPRGRPMWSPSLPAQTFEFSGVPQVPADELQLANGRLQRVDTAQARGYATRACGTASSQIRLSANAVSIPNGRAEWRARVPVFVKPRPPV
mmetsp:Transcript_66384/g.184958  ORF Transcript_66384/g.184958 Transcript_66384/m.184958 type:complete len:260 (+) Transcript_66384:909-1688(+)